MPRWFLLLAALTACSESTHAEEPAAPAREKAEAPPAAIPAVPGTRGHAPRPSAYAVPERTDAELAEQLDAACAEGAKRGVPWLIEVTAPWCGDCRALAALETYPPLSDELARWPRVQVNVGDFDRHAALRKWLDVRAIAHWSVLESRECGPALGRSPIVLQRTLEPRSGVPVSPDSLAEWLVDARTSWQEP